MGVAFSQNATVLVPLAGVPTPRHPPQRLSGASSPLPHGIVTQAESAASCSASDRAGELASTGDAAGSANSNSCSASQSTLAQQLQNSLKALSLDWTIVDRELNLITVRFAAALLTSRLRVQRGTPRGVGGGDDDIGASHGDSGSHKGVTPGGVSDTPAGVDAAAFAAAAAEDDVGAQELYVSAALRLAAVQLGPDGLQRLIVALAFLANGGESREERRMRRHASVSTASAMRRAESSLQEINHFQRGAGFTGSASAAGLPSSATMHHAMSGGGSAFNTSGSVFPSLAGSGSVLASRRFSTAPPSQTQPPSTNVHAAHGMASSHPGGAAQASSTSIDHLAHSSPFRGGVPVGAMHGYPHMQRQPSSGRSSEEAGHLLGASSLFHRHRSVSPLNGLTANLNVGPGLSLRPRHISEAELLATEEHSYNNMLLTSMNARSTLLSPLRTGPHGELLYSASSFATLMSLSTGAGAHTGRSYRGGGGDYGNNHFFNNSSSGGGLRSPVSPFLHPTTQWVIPPAPLAGQAPSTGGMASANSSIPNSLSSMASPPSVPDARRRSDTYSRRLVQPLSPYQISRLSVAGAAAVLSRPASEDANLNTLMYHLPPGMSSNNGGGSGVDVYGSGYDGSWRRAAGDGAAGAGANAGAAPLLSSGVRDSALQLLRPEAVLTALCSLLAHLQLSTDDVTNLVTLLVVAVLEVQADAQLRRLIETDDEVPPESLQVPSMKVVRTAVRDSLGLLLSPLYVKTRLSLCAAAGVMEATVQAVQLAAGVLDSAAGTQPAALRASALMPLPPVVPPVAPHAHHGERNLSVPAPAPQRTTPADAAPHASSYVLGDADLAAHVHALHDFFETCVPLESTPSTWSAGTATAATAARATAVRRISSAPRGSNTRQQQQQQQQQHGVTTKTTTTTATNTAAGATGHYSHSSYSDSAAGPTSSGSMSRSDATDAIATVLTSFPTRVDSNFTAPSQEEVRLASNFLMDVETAFVLHYAEAIQEGEAGKRRTTTNANAASCSTSSLPSSPASPPKRLRHRTGSINKRPTLHTPSTPTLASATAAAAPSPLSSSSSSSPSAKHYPWRRRSDADPDLFVQLSGNATVWPLRTRLLVRRHEYAYVYDAMASTMALLREENLYTGDGAQTDATGKPASRVPPHPHTPIALIDLNKATVEAGGNDLQVLSGPGDVEVVSLMPSRVSRNTLVSHARRSAAAATATTVAAAAATTTTTSATPTSGSQNSTPNSASFSNPPLDQTTGSNGSGGGGSRAVHTFDDLLNCCWADGYQQDMEVYRMKGSTGTMYLLTVPAEADRVMVPAAGAATPTTAATTTTATTTSRTTQDGAAAAEDVVRASVIRSFERNRLVRPAVLSLASSATTATGGSAKEVDSRAGAHGDEAHRGPSGKGPRVQCAYNDGNSEVLSLELGSEPTRIAAYPLRLLYQGVLHHFFFPNPSARDHWYQQLVQLSWMTQSKAYLEKVAAAPHDVERFMRNRISFPTGPGAFECLDMLGAGTFGRVLLVQHRLSKRLFAMKVIRKSGFHGIRNIIEARREKKILDQLDCPYIMKIHSSFQTDSRVYMLFDYLSGAELLLHTQSAHSNHFDETTSRFYIAELAIAVEYLRVRGIVHRDIKGDNLVLDAEGHVVLTDFGFAKNILSPSAANAAGGAAALEAGAPPPQIVRQHTSCGTLAYIAPEVLCNSRRRSGYGLAVDWWSLGVVLFTFLTGYFPFLKQTGPETSQAIVSSPLQFPPRPALSEDARSLLDQLLQKDPEKRISCLADMRHHRFFEGFDWTACRERRLPPPLVLHKDSYRSPRTTADARQLLQDRVRRSLAWSQGQAAVPYVAPSHSRRSASDKLTIKHQPQLEEEQAELRLVEQAYGSDCMPKPLSSFNDVFGPLFEQQERCGSDRDESDVEDLAMEDYVADLSRPTLDTLKRLKDSDVSQDLCSSFSDMSLNSVCPEYVYPGGAGEERGAAAQGAAARHGKALTMPTLPPFVNFSEDLYCDVVLAKYNASTA